MISTQPTIITKEMEVNAAILLDLIKLRKRQNKSKKDAAKYKTCFRQAINRFAYIVAMHTNKYKKFANYEDLYQEGMVGLVLALNNFDPERSKNFFKIANWYIKTRIKRSANKFDVINVPMNVAKDVALNRVSDMPVVADLADDPYEFMEKEQLIDNIQIALDCLDDVHKTIICKYHGINERNEKILIERESLTNIAKQMKMSRINVQKALAEAYDILLNNDDLNSFNEGETEYGI